MTSITQTTPSASSALTASSGDAIVFEHVVKTFSKGSARRHALQGLSFQARPGRVTGLVGPDGAGKTTTMRLAAGLLRPDEGRVAIFGLDSVRDADRAKRLVAYMPQRFGLYEDLTVAENLALYADLHGLPSSQRRPLFDELLTTTGLAPFTSRLAGRLSGGMQQKLALSCSLLSDPRLLLLDEPTSGVDPASRRDLWRIVLNVVRRRNVAALVSTVYMDETQRCDHVVMLRQGRALDAGPPEQFLQRVQGRCFLIPAHSEQRRTVQLHVSTLPGVVDAPLQANGVRVVLSPDAPPETRSAIASHNGAAVTPRFEDAFIDLL
ncbi:MAG: ABC transporter ATP-binding protein, partial [Planctomycetota bacterium]